MAGCCAVGTQHGRGGAAVRVSGPLPAATNQLAVPCPATQRWTPQKAVPMCFIGRHTFPPLLTIFQAAFRMLARAPLGETVHTGGAGQPLLAQ